MSCRAAPPARRCAGADSAEERSHRLPTSWQASARAGRTTTPGAELRGRDDAVGAGVAGSMIDAKASASAMGEAEPVRGLRPEARARAG